MLENNSKNKHNQPFRWETITISLQIGEYLYEMYWLNPNIG